MFGGRGVQLCTLALANMPPVDVLVADPGPDRRGGPGGACGKRPALRVGRHEAGGVGRGCQHAYRRAGRLPRGLQLPPHWPFAAPLLAMPAGGWRARRCCALWSAPAALGTSPTGCASGRGGCHASTAKGLARRGVHSLLACMPAGPETLAALRLPESMRGPPFGAGALCSCPRLVGLGFLACSAPAAPAMQHLPQANCLAALEEGVVETVISLLHARNSSPPSEVRPCALCGPMKPLHARSACACAGRLP